MHRSQSYPTLLAAIADDASLVVVAAGQSQLAPTVSFASVLADSTPPQSPRSSRDSSSRPSLKASPKYKACRVKMRQQLEASKMVPTLSEDLNIDDSNKSGDDDWSTCFESLKSGDDDWISCCDHGAGDHVAYAGNVEGENKREEDNFFVAEEEESILIGEEEEREMKPMPLSETKKQNKKSPPPLGKNESVENLRTRIGSGKLHSRRGRKHHSMERSYDKKKDYDGVDDEIKRRSSSCQVEIDRCSFCQASGTQIHQQPLQGHPGPQGASNRKQAGGQSGGNNIVSPFNSANHQLSHSQPSPLPPAQLRETGGQVGIDKILPSFLNSAPGNQDQQQPLWQQPGRRKGRASTTISSSWNAGDNYHNHPPPPPPPPPYQRQQTRGQRGIGRQSPFLEKKEQAEYPVEEEENGNRKKLDRRGKHRSRSSSNSRSHSRERRGKNPHQGDCKSKRRNSSSQIETECRSSTGNLSQSSLHFAPAELPCVLNQASEREVQQQSQRFSLDSDDHYYSDSPPRQPTQGRPGPQRASNRTFSSSILNPASHQYHQSHLHPSQQPGFMKSAQPTVSLQCNNDMGVPTYNHEVSHFLPFKGNIDDGESDLSIMGNFVQMPPNIGPSVNHRGNSTRSNCNQDRECQHLDRGHTSTLASFETSERQSDYMRDRNPRDIQTPQDIQDPESAVSESPIDDLHHDYDSKGRCIHHPHIRLRKKKLFGRGWKVLMLACPDCCVRELWQIRIGEDEMEVEKPSSEQWDKSGSPRHRSVASGGEAMPPMQLQCPRRSPSRDGRRDASTAKNASAKVIRSKFQSDDTASLTGSSRESRSTDELNSKDDTQLTARSLSCERVDTTFHRAHQRGPFIGDDVAVESSRQKKKKKKSRSMSKDRQLDLQPQPRQSHAEQNTMTVIHMEYTDTKGRHGFYIGQVNGSFVPHGMGTMEYDNGKMKDGEWKNGRYHRSDCKGKGSSGSRSRSRSKSRKGEHSGSRSRSASRGLRSRSASRQRE